MWEGYVVCVDRKKSVKRWAYCVLSNRVFLMLIPSTNPSTILPSPLFYSFLPFVFCFCFCFLFSPSETKKIFLPKRAISLSGKIGTQISNQTGNHNIKCQIAKIKLAYRRSPRVANRQTAIYYYLPLATKWFHFSLLHFHFAV